MRTLPAGRARARRPTGLHRAKRRLDQSPSQRHAPGSHEVSKRHRDGLGLETTGVIATEFVDEETNASGAIVIFRLKGGLVLALYPRSELAKDADIPVGPPKTGEFSIGQLVESSAEVDVLLAQAGQAGATLTGRPHDRPWGIYSGYFRDPDGHLWEIIWNPPTENTTQ
jgi:hypothetical protein